ncbi:MAG: CPBP family intramembrane glutamic endopeptidase [Myxococcota bacterium]
MSLTAALLLLVSVWSVLLGSSLAAPRLGVELATFGGCALATGLVLGTARRVPGPPGCWGRRIGLLLLGALAGIASYPGWIAGLECVYGAAELAPVPPFVQATPVNLVAAVALAPLFEELLYRERLLGALRRRVGGFGAVGLCSGLFALGHPEPRAHLATWLVGLGLGGLRVGSCSVVPCIGLHAGLNLAAWLALSAGWWSPLGPGLAVAAVAAGVCLRLGRTEARGREASRR